MRGLFPLSTGKFLEPEFQQSRGIVPDAEGDQRAEEQGQSGVVHGLVGLDPVQEESQLLEEGQWQSLQGRPCEILHKIYGFEFKFVPLKKLQNNGTETILQQTTSQLKLLG